MKETMYSKEAIYKKFARFDNPATFYFQAQSKAYITYGEYATGIVKYTKKEREHLQKNMEEGLNTYGKIQLYCTSLDISKQKKDLLARTGFECEDIAKVSPSFFNKTDKFHDTTQREIPNIVQIPIDLSSVKPGVIFVNHMLSNIQRGKDLLTEERNKLLGILMAHNDGALPEILIEYFNLTDEQIKNEESLWRHYFITKDKISGLDEIERKAYNLVEANRILYRAKLIDKEISTYNNGKGLEDLATDVAKLLFEKVQNFQPARLLQIEVPVFWDFKSFIHIYLRHVKETQVGDFFKSKSSFQYDYKEIEKLITKVLKQEKESIINHFKNNKDKKFFRAGEMGVYYNGDYYSFDISPKGRLETFYKI